ncbi:acyl-CoA dehydrogenase family protein [uncultured Sphaerotilus sp.]|uniref:acyl-CoA dehydrogenase family protein n=1 Tax=uncultured Sphaerotilus sp. TaxID=474984 RepID=UPI0030CA28DE
MSTWTPPLQRMQFVIEQVLDAPASWRQQPAFADLDADTAREVLEQAGRFAHEVIAPINGSGDTEGCRWEANTVKTPTGYPAAWKAFVDGGWPSLPCAPEDGGQGLPSLLNAALFEMLVSANHAWTMYPGLLHGAYEAIRHHAVPELRARYLPKVVSGEWLSTMNLTEPQAGSDLGLTRTRCEPVDPDAPVVNGAAVTVTGNKIFISGGDQDLTDNIVHLVLARLPGAPAGTKGLTLVLVPKWLPDGRRNGAWCDGIEKKMGIKGSATAQMRFEQAEGWILGEPNAGLAAMFLMMNSARLHVGMQGLGHLEAACQIATSYARERLQLRAPARPADANPAHKGPDPIVWHPAMRRTLLDLHAQCEGARVMAYWTAILLDESEHHPDAAVRKERDDLVALLTPILKAFLTHLGHHGANEALGVLGGHGYVHDWGIEQHVRDSRIALIYEGTNEIQAIDLLMRKVLDRPQRLDRLLDVFRVEIDTLLAAQDDAAGTLRTWAATLTDEVETIVAATAALQAGRAAAPDRPFLVADDYLHALGHSLLAWSWARLARAALNDSDTARRDWLLTITQHGRTWLLPAARWRWQRVADATLALGWIPG